MGEVLVVTAELTLSLLSGKKRGDVNTNLTLQPPVNLLPIPSIGTTGSHEQGSLRSMCKGQLRKAQHQVRETDRRVDMRHKRR